MVDRYKDKMDSERFRVMREGGTEKPHSGKYWKRREKGIFTCAACGEMLFLSLHQKESTDGLPLFSRPANKKHLEDGPGDPEGVEVHCKKCKSHLGHRLQSGQYRINSISLDLYEVPELDFDTEAAYQDTKNKKEEPTAAATNTLTFSLGALAVGVALGAGTTAAFMQGSAAYCAAPVVATSTVLTETRPAATSTSVRPKTTAPVTTPATTSATSSPTGTI